MRPNDPSDVSSWPPVMADLKNPVTLIRTTGPVVAVRLDTRFSPPSAMNLTNTVCSAGTIRSSPRWNGADMMVPSGIANGSCASQPETESAATSPFAAATSITPPCSPAVRCAIARLTTALATARSSSVEPTPGPNCSACRSVSVCSQPGPEPVRPVISRAMSATASCADPATAARTVIPLSTLARPTPCIFSWFGAAAGTSPRPPLTLGPTARSTANPRSVRGAVPVSRTPLGTSMSTCSRSAWLRRPWISEIRSMCWARSSSWAI